MKFTRVSISVFFFLLGFIYAAWIVRLPELQRQTSLTDGGLGVALFFGAAGSFGAIFISASLINRFSSPAVLQAMSLTYALLPLGLPFARGGISLSLLFFIMGGVAAVFDVALNTQGAFAEQMERKSVMSAFHALYSTGAAAGGLLAGWLGRFSMELHFSVVAVSSLVLITYFARGLVRERDGAQKPLPAEGQFLPTSYLKVLAFVMFCSLLAEGAIAEWSAKFMLDVSKAPESFAPYGLAGFSAGMLAGRFAGDRLRGRFADIKLVMCGAIAAALSVAYAVFFASAWSTIGAFTAAGLGLSVLVPVCFSAAGKVTPDAPERSIAQLTSVGYAGFMLGPPVIGFASNAYGLRAAVFLVAVLMILSFAAAAFIRAEKSPG